MVQQIKTFLVKRQKLVAAEYVCKEVFEGKLFSDVGFYTSTGTNYIELCDKETGKTLMTFTGETIEDVLLYFLMVFFPKETDAALEEIVREEKIEDLLD